jgi:enamidase
MVSMGFINIGTLLTGDVADPIRSGADVLVRGRQIAAVGMNIGAGEADTVVDVRGATLAPALWDSHYHPYFGDFSPRQEAIGTVSRVARAGITHLVSAGAGHQPGMYLPSANLPNVQALSAVKLADPSRARDAAGSKALAIAMTHAWQNNRLYGARVHAETVIAEDGFTAADFEDMVANGVRILKFLRPVSRLSDAVRYREWAADSGLLVMTHTGNRALAKDAPSIDASLQGVDPDIAGHINGGPTPAPRSAIDWLVERGRAALDIVFIGNMAIASDVVRRVLERGEAHRLLIGSDLPGGTGIVPTAVLRTIQLLHHLTGVPVPVLYAMGSGNTARAYGLPGGRIEVGQPADLVVWDPVDGSETESFIDCVAYGDRPYPGLIAMEGEVVQYGNPLLLEPKRMPNVFVRDVGGASADATDPIRVSS